MLSRIGKISILICISFSLLSCNDSMLLGTANNAKIEKTPESPSTPPPVAEAEEYDDSEEGVSIPTWVNGSYLVGCNTDKGSSDSSALLLCGLVDPDTKKHGLFESDSIVNFEVRDQSGIISSSSEKVLSGSSFHFAVEVEIANLDTISISIEFDDDSENAAFQSTAYDALTQKANPDDFLCLDKDQSFQTCEPENSTEPTADPAAPENLVVVDHQVFLTSAVFSGGFEEGVLGADANCVTHAKAGNLSGDWKALIAHTDTSVFDRINGTGRVISLAGAVVATDLTSMVNDTDSLSLIKMDENRNTVAGTVFFGLGKGGLGDSQTNCASWTGNGSVISVEIGSFGSLPLLIACSTLVRSRLICVSSIPAQ